MFSTPTVTRNLLIINVVAFVATLAMPWLAQVGGLHFFLASGFGLYQLLSYMFLHAGFTHLLFNMFALWMFGRVMESVWGPRKFLFYYISCGIGAGLVQEVAQFVQFSSIAGGLSIPETFALGNQYASSLNGWTTVGASGAIYAILLAFGMTFPEERIFIFPLPLPIKAKWFVIGYAGIELLSAIATTGDGVAHAAHLGGMLFGFFMIRYWNSHPTSGYGRGNGRQFFDNLRESFERQRNKHHQQQPRQDHGATGREDDWQYNAKKKANQDEIDRILDKIRKSGYDSLTKEEKQKLFDSSNSD